MLSLAARRWADATIPAVPAREPPLARLNRRTNAGHTSVVGEESLESPPLDSGNLPPRHILFQIGTSFRSRAPRRDMLGSSAE